jgi:hypothetical protein
VTILAPNRLELLGKLGLRGCRIAEIGVWLGEYSESLLKHDPAELWLVDPWMHQPETVWCDWMNKLQQEMEEVTAAIYRRYRDEPRVKIVRLFSEAAAPLFSDGYFDLVYVDANHSYESCLADLRLWYPKVKPGGVLAGHDFTGTWTGVEKAVLEFMAEKGLQLAGVTGEREWSTWVIREKSAA